MIEQELLDAPARIVHIPTVVGAVVPVYNVPGLTRELKFSGPLLAEIFLGRITNWNDPAIARLNEGVALPPIEISPVFRADSSGTSFVWSDFLSKVSPEWRRLVGANRLSTLPVGLSVKGGSEGVSGTVRQTRGAIGYVELTYATRNGLDFGLVQNREGEFVRASIASMTAAANAAVGSMPRDLRVSITNAPGKGVYPVTSFTWLLLYESPGDRRRSRLMVDFITWALGDGQKRAPDLGYAPLPPQIVEPVRDVLRKIKT
jgi:phosphate transport system substrate-binding protein